MGLTPRLTVGLPVYNGEEHLAESLDALLGQSYEDFELVISDNASSDGTAEICRSYQEQDSRIRYFRQPNNIGSAGNHNFLVDRAQGELFKWASHDDLYARDLLERCVAALDEHPQVVLAHSWTAMIDVSGTVTMALEYPLATASLRAPERFRSMLFGRGGDDFYGVMRAGVVRPVLRQGSHHHADRTMMTGVCLYGPFYQVPEWLYFRREHPEAALRRTDAQQGGQSWPERDWPTGRARCANMDPRRANHLLHPTARLYAEYVWAYVAGIHRAPLSRADRWECYGYLAEWVAAKAHLARPQEADKPVLASPTVISVDALVAGRDTMRT